MNVTGWTLSQKKLKKMFILFIYGNKNSVHGFIYNILDMLQKFMDHIIIWVFSKPKILWKGKGQI